jgi:F-type H+-transporting ATPase subunit delta
MRSRKLSSRYALSLLDLTDEQNNLDITYQDARFIISVLDQNKRLKNILVNPVIKQAMKLSILQEVFSGRINDQLLKFVRFIVEKNREDYLYDIMKRFLELRNDKLGIVDVEVKTAVLFNDKQTRDLKERLESILSKQVEMNFIIDKNILGGFIARVGDTLYDASIKNQLNNLKRKFLQGSTF